ncbi:MAG: TIGR00269 family protein, partial [Candidatus Geothermarchaeales archaeon]
MTVKTGQGWRCVYCNNEAFYHRKYSGETLCRKHLIESIDKKVYREVRKHLREDSRVGLAVSGGKDSLVTAHSVNKLRRRFPKMELTGLIVDEGIEGYRLESMEKAEKELSRLGIRRTTFSFKENFSTTVDEVVGLGSTLMPCTVCGVLRRRAINIMAEEAGLEVVLSGHNADDQAQTIFLNVIQGNVKNLTQVVEVEGFVERIKPLRDVLEKEVVLYALISDIDYHSDPCPYTRRALRNDVRNFLVSLEESHPGSTYSIIRAAEKIREGMKTQPRM